MKKLILTILTIILLATVLVATTYAGDRKIISEPEDSIAAR